MVADAGCWSPPVRGRGVQRQCSPQPAGQATRSTGERDALARRLLEPTWERPDGAAPEWNRLDRGGPSYGAKRSTGRAMTGGWWAWHEPARLVRAFRVPASANNAMPLPVTEKTSELVECFQGNLAA